MTQKRIRALDTYISGAVALSSLYIPVDSINFGSEPFKVALEDLIEDDHPEKGRREGLASASVSVVFDIPYSTRPIGREPEVYREVEQPSGTFRRYQVSWGFTVANQPSITGFQLTILESDLTGIVVEWDYK
ncbi:hypothetical protein KAR91_80245 [Candidatus Pacearchaeota archaeon]|nr:hypothetical protein [Candidatus Pacearchaeota archaeon]